MIWLAVALGGAVGAPLRFVADRWVQRRTFGDDAPTAWPLGTLVVNLVGAFALGVIVGAARTGRGDPVLIAALGTGLCGALTTFSTTSVETMRLVEADRWGAAARVAGANLGLSVVVAALGLGIAAAIW
ncbi:MAG: CrcB family protein [Microthrixaceae bacterium]|nr:CrcB family protein [Microthrixaceae bacterium]